MSDLATDNIQIPTGAIVFVSVDMILRNNSSSNFVSAAIGYSSDNGSTWVLPSSLITLAESAVVGKRIQLALR
ncbi:sialidase family protein, partial [Vibrio cholerae]|uniref:sialidase family protein n=1 Tax=Vibrio cholerae TaxID=666 RepID=UPI001F40E28D